ncbi:uncharacterized protein ASCRUDRAFT_68838 [Ascoidea rubescens DSM 1968]|uniref:Uncharacterized protein n=1 Tax=Ascoidea rubescens DSM 1968 TaxID=1344418 RepID=A0A1D2VNA6_9ASCO|nr:hypothetical protein ASCRUDRAFT_68838 [Ascoidea rubescens DSM 1968]ODV63057.1 hypothetical protein ASCRUDRAFT_68838 [Ascoidea rubescens DSM 1968]
MPTFESKPVDAGNLENQERVVLSSNQTSNEETQKSDELEYELEYELEHDLQSTEKKTSNHTLGKITSTPIAFQKNNTTPTNQNNEGTSYFNGSPTHQEKTNRALSNLSNLENINYFYHGEQLTPTAYDQIQKESAVTEINSHQDITNKIFPVYQAPFIDYPPKPKVEKVIRENKAPIGGLLVPSMGNSSGNKNNLALNEFFTDDYCRQSTKSDLQAGEDKSVDNSVTKELSELNNGLSRSQSQNDSGINLSFSELMFKNNDSLFDESKGLKSDAQLLNGEIETEDDRTQAFSDIQITEKRERKTFENKCSEKADKVSLIKDISNILGDLSAIIFGSNSVKSIESDEKKVNSGLKNTEFQIDNTIDATDAAKSKTSLFIFPKDSDSVEKENISKASTKDDSFISSFKTLEENMKPIENINSSKRNSFKNITENSDLNDNNNFDKNLFGVSNQTFPSQDLENNSNVFEKNKALDNEEKLKNINDNNMENQLKAEKLQDLQILGDLKESRQMNQKETNSYHQPLLEIDNKENQVSGTKNKRVSLNIPIKKHEAFQLKTMRGFNKNSSSHLRNPSQLSLNSDQDKYFAKMAASKALSSSVVNFNAKNSFSQNATSSKTSRRVSFQNFNVLNNGEKLLPVLSSEQSKKAFTNTKKRFNEVKPSVPIDQIENETKLKKLKTEKNHESNRKLSFDQTKNSLSLNNNNLVKTDNHSDVPDKFSSGSESIGFNELESSIKSVEFNEPESPIKSNIENDDLGNYSYKNFRDSDIHNDLENPRAHKETVENMSNNDNFKGVYETEVIN